MNDQGARDGQSGVPATPEAATDGEANAMADASSVASRKASEPPVAAVVVPAAGGAPTPLRSERDSGPQLSVVSVGDATAADLDEASSTQAPLIEETTPKVAAVVGDGSTEASAKAAKAAKEKVGGDDTDGPAAEDPTVKLPGGRREPNKTPVSGGANSAAYDATTVAVATKKPASIPAASIILESSLRGSSATERMARGPIDEALGKGKGWSPLDVTTSTDGGVSLRRNLLAIVFALGVVLAMLAVVWWRNMHIEPQRGAAAASPASALGAALPIVAEPAPPPASAVAAAAPLEDAEGSTSVEAGAAAADVLDAAPATSPSAAASGARPKKKRLPPRPAPNAEPPHDAP